MSLEKARENMAKMIAYYENIKLPFTEIRINSFSVVKDVNIYIEANISRLKNKPVMSQEWHMCYLRLYELKTIIQRYDNKL